MRLTSESKKNQIAKSILATKNKRKTQTCKVYHLKISSNLDNLNRLFTEAKWFYNHLLNQNDIYNINVRKDIKVNVKILDKTEVRELNYLSSQMKKGLHDQILSSVKTLSSLKKKGFKIGHLKFKKEINSIDLPQFNITYKLLENNRKLKIQGFKKHFNLLGFKQLPKNCEFANAKLIRKPSGFFIALTTFVPKEIKNKTNKNVGIDLGIKDNIVTSDGDKFNCKISESERLKNLQRKLFKKKKGSNNRKKIIHKIRKEYESVSNKKKESVNQIVCYLKNKYDTIVIQDENLVGWQKGLFGKQISNSILGAIKAKLKSLESTIIIPRHYPTTQLCPSCGSLNKHGLDKRTYSCSCGYSGDRDIHAANNILLMGKDKIHPHKELVSTPLEKKTNADLDKTKKVSYYSVKKEDTTLYSCISSLLSFLPINAESEIDLLNSILVESAITPSQKIVMNNYFKSLISKKEDEIKKLEDKVLLSYGGKYQRDKMIKNGIRQEITCLEKDIENYKYAISHLGK